MRVETELRESRATWGTFEWSDFSGMFLERLNLEDLGGATILDLGTGNGRLALHLAPRGGRVVGIDTDEDALAMAREHARSQGLTNATFIPADADSANYRLLVRSPIDYIVANYFMSEAAVRASAGALRNGGKFLFACHHEDHWTESGRVGRFSFSADRMRSLLTAGGLRVEFLGVDRRVVTYRGLEEIAKAAPRVHEKFLADGRWRALESRFGDGPAQLTWSTLVGAAKK